MKQESQAVRILLGTPLFANYDPGPKWHSAELLMLSVLERSPIRASITVSLLVFAVECRDV